MRSARQDAPPAAQTGGAARSGSIRATSAANLLLLVFGLGLSVATARGLGPTGRGIFTVATTIAGIALLLAGMGIQQALAYFIARQPSRARVGIGLSVVAGLS